MPPSLIKKDLIPKMKANPNYLAEEKIRILDKDGQEVSPSSINWNTDEATHFNYRQDTGRRPQLARLRAHQHSEPLWRLHA